MAVDSFITLIFSITPLNLLMYSLLHLSLEYPCPGWLVVVGNFENVGGVYVMIMPSAHDMVALNIEFEHRDLQPMPTISLQAQGGMMLVKRHTPLYVAEYMPLASPPGAMVV